MTVLQQLAIHPEICCHTFQESIEISNFSITQTHLSSLHIVNNVQPGIIPFLSLFDLEHGQKATFFSPPVFISAACRAFNAVQGDPSQFQLESRLFIHSQASSLCSPLCHSLYHFNFNTLSTFSTLGTFPVGVVLGGFL